jgi:hypothetical protein
MQILKLIIQPIKFGGPALSVRITCGAVCNADFCDGVESTPVATGEYTSRQRRVHQSPQESTSVATGGYISRHRRVTQSTQEGKPVDTGG